MQRSWMCIKRCARTIVSREIDPGFVHTVSLEHCTGKATEAAKPPAKYKRCLKQMDLPLPGLPH